MSGIVFSELISRLSTYQLRAHYLFYHALKYVFNNHKLNSSHELDGMKLFFPLRSFITSMDYKRSESETICCFGLLIGHIVSGLAKEGLISNTYDFGPFHTDGHDHNHKKGEAGGIFTPTPLGIELFGWARVRRIGT